MFKKKLKANIAEAAERTVYSAISDYDAIVNLLYDEKTLKSFGTVAESGVEPAWSELLKAQCAVQFIVFSGLRPDDYRQIIDEFLETLSAVLGHNPDNKITAYLKKDINRPAWRKDMMAYFNLPVGEIGSHVAKKILKKLPKKIDSTHEELIAILMGARLEATHKGLLTFTYTFL